MRKIRRPFNYDSKYSERYGYTGQSFDPNFNPEYMANSIQAPQQNSSSLGEAVIGKVARKQGGKLAKRGLSGLFSKGGVTGSAQGLTTPGATASANLGSSSLSGILKPAGAIGGGLLGLEGISKGNEEKGALGGALSGFSVGGPLGAAIGAAVGGLGALFNKKKENLSDSFTGRLNPIAQGDYNKDNMRELDGLFEVQARSVEGIDPNLTQDIRSFREAVNTLGTDNQDNDFLSKSGAQLLNNYFNHIDSGSFKFDSNANKYASSIINVLNSIDSESAGPYIEKLNTLNKSKKRKRPGSKPLGMGGF